MLGQSIFSRDRSGVVRLVKAGGVWLGASKHVPFLIGKEKQARRGALSYIELARSGELPV